MSFPFSVFKIYKMNNLLKVLNAPQQSLSVLNLTIPLWRHNALHGIKHSDFSPSISLSGNSLKIIPENNFFFLNRYLTQ